jgi:tetratricopeptide (TPR) repeat protein
MAQEVRPEKRFVPVLLPWLAAGGALVVYLLTLNHWISLSSLTEVTKLTNRNWQPEVVQPLYFLITSPLRLLPATAIPLALNLLSAVFGALTLALLARSVALLPHDRTEQQRVREKSPFSLLSTRAAWLPPLLAVLACGLQLTFWENATAASSDILDLLVLAYSIRCLLEFRVDGRDSWLYRASLVYGAGIANNWAMIGLFPLFLVALIWIRGLGFFNSQFLSRMFLMGLGGLSLYLLLPLLQLFSGSAEGGFWVALKANLIWQKSMLLSFVFNKFNLLRGERPLWVLGLFSILPLLALGIRWPSFSGDTSKLGLRLANLSFNILHGFLLGLCLLVTLDPQFSPRHYHPVLSAYGLKLLPLYYFIALSIGYYSGYFLVIFGARPAGRMRMMKHYPQPVCAAVLGAVFLAALLVPAALVARNLPKLRMTNGPSVRHYAEAAAKALPEQRAVVLSDDSRRLVLAEAASAATGRARDSVFLDTSVLSSPDYHDYLRRKHPGVWDFPLPKDIKQIPDMDLLGMVVKLSGTHQIYYLHPSFGYYFEVFCPEPQGVVYKLNMCPTNTLVTSPPAQPVLAYNEEFWAKADTEALGRVQKAIRVADKDKAPAGALAQVARKLQLVDEPNRDASYLAMYYSQARNAWGVEVQKSGQLAKAAAHFQRALDLNSENLVAKVNLECNGALQKSGKAPVDLTKASEDRLTKQHRGWDLVIRENGPFDEPSFCFTQGGIFAQGGNFRQAAQEFGRVVELAPDYFPARLSLAQVFMLSQLHDEELRVLKEIRTATPRFEISRTNEMQMLWMEAGAHLTRNDPQSAEHVVQSALKRFPGDEDFLSVATKVYMDFGQYSNALTTIEQQLKLKPDNQGALFFKGNACLQLNQYAPAIDALTKVLSMETNANSTLSHLARFMRARAYLGSDRLPEAQADYEVLAKALPNEFPVYFDLGEIAFRKKDTSAAIRHYETYLKYAPTNFVDDIKVASARLNELRGSPR